MRRAVAIAVQSARRGDTHRATVIQTQTPISPGNSGGPLLGDSGRILGVNSFKGLEGENLNFAVSVVDIAAFLDAAPKVANVQPPQLASAPPPQAAPKAASKAGSKPPPQPASTGSAPSGCQPATVYDSRLDTSVKPDADQRLGIDTNCDNIADIVMVTPADKAKPILALIDSNYDGKVDIIVVDKNRDGRWDISYHDVDFDGTIDIVGYHPDGKLKPSRYGRYAAK